MNDWIEFKGGECPVPLTAVVQIKCGRGVYAPQATNLAGDIHWDACWREYGDEGMFYRIDKDCTRIPEAQERVSAPKILTKAAALMEERGKQYDQPEGERSMGRAVGALNAILGRQALTESEGWLLLQLLKDVRDRQRAVPHVDSLEDGVAYAALKAEARLAEGKDV